MVSQVPLLISFNVEEVGKQVAASTQTFKEGRISSQRWNNARIWLIMNTKVYAILLIHKKAIANLERIPIKSVVDKDYGISLDQRTHLRAELNVRIMSRVDGTRLLSWIVLFRAIAEDGETVNKKELETRLAAKGMLALQGLQQSRFITQLMLGLQKCS
nr:hypothetical protein [Tanacetum cinerariifolium]